MRIVQIIPDFTLGGVQKAGCVLAKSMAQQGHTLFIIGMGMGPRFNNYTENNLSYISVDEFTTAQLLAQIVTIVPDVVHIHTGLHEEIPQHLVEKIDGLTPKPLVVITPVFGRPPENKKLLTLAKNCCVGDYTLYRLRKWLNVEVKDLISQGLFSVPLTPYEPIGNIVQSKKDAKYAARKALNIPQDAFVMTRIGRDHFIKWHDCYPSLINEALGSIENAYWLSIGFPKELHLETLKEKWGDRIINFPQTSDYGFLMQILAAADVQVFFSFNGECFSSTICESICSGVPVIAGCNIVKDNGQSEQVIDGITGYLAANNNDALKYLIQLSGNPSKLAKLQETAKGYGLNNWQMDIVGKELLNFYDYFLGKKTDDVTFINAFLQKQSEFSQNYKKRMLGILTKSPSGTYNRIMTYLKLNIVESWNIFLVGRKINKFLK